MSLCFQVEIIALRDSEAQGISLKLISRHLVTFRVRDNYRIYERVGLSHPPGVNEQGHLFERGLLFFASIQLSAATYQGSIS